MLGRLARSRVELPLRPLRSRFHQLLPRRALRAVSQIAKEGNMAIPDAVRLASRWMVLIMLWMTVSSTAARSQTVLSERQLIELARDTYQRADWIYAALHMTALLQRTPR